MVLGSRVSVEDFINASKQFCEISNKIGDGWTLHANKIDETKSFIQKFTFVQCTINNVQYLLKAEYVIYYNLSYGVPSFSFNVWNSSGMLLSLEEIRQMSLIDIKREDFYRVITQQEHPIFSRPYFIMHPCHTSDLLDDFRTLSKNIIVTFLSLITPLLRINLPLEYGL